MTQPQHRRIERCMAWVTLAGAVFVVLYWTVFFAGPARLAGDDQLARGFESAFPVADSALAVLLLVTSRHLFTQHRAGGLLLVAAGSAATYLGLLDVTFYAGRSLYGSPSPAALTELVANVLCLGGGGLAVRAGWVLWRES